MASALSSGSRRHLEPVEGKDIIFCHGCENEWYRDTSAASPRPCSSCGSEIVEIVSVENDPRESTDIPFADFRHILRSATNVDDDNDDFAQRLHRQLFLPRQRFGEHDFGNDHDHDHDHEHDHVHGHEDHDHDHGHHHHDDDNVGDSDPEEADIEEHVHYAPLGNTYIYHQTIRRSSVPPNSRQQPGSRFGSARTGNARRPTFPDPAEPAAMMTTFAEFINDFNAGRVGRSGPDTLFPANTNTRTFTFGTRAQGGPIGTIHRTTLNGRRVGTVNLTIARGPPRGAPGGAETFNTLLAEALGNVGPPPLNENQDRAANNAAGNIPLMLQHIIGALLNRDAVSMGDAVHSDEALERIIAMLMENSPGASGPPPASQSAIDTLERKKIDAKMIGPEGHAECTICISQVDCGEEVLVLSCKHWFHEECVVMWLKQHNTCPVCRHPVEAASADNAGPNASASAHAHASAGAGFSTTNNRPGANNANARAPGGLSGSTGSAFDSGGPLAGPRPRQDSGVIAASIAAAAAANAAAADALNREINAGPTASGNASAGNAVGSTSGFAEVQRMLGLQGMGGMGGLSSLFGGMGGGTQDATANASQRNNGSSGGSGSGNGNGIGPPSSSSPTASRPRLSGQERQEQRLDAIRSAAGLPPLSQYRSPRERERTASAERRRRDSHSPIQDHAMPSRLGRYGRNYEDGSGMGSGSGSGSGNVSGSGNGGIGGGSGSGSDTRAPSSSMFSSASNQHRSSPSANSGRWFGLGVVPSETGLGSGPASASGSDSATGLGASGEIRNRERERAAQRLARIRSVEEQSEQVRMRVVERRQEMPSFSSGWMPQAPSGSSAHRGGNPPHASRYYAQEPSFEDSYMSGHEESHESNDNIYSGAVSGADMPAAFWGAGGHVPASDGHSQRSVGSNSGSGGGNGGANGGGGLMAFLRGLGGNNQAPRRN